jgi:hypothetical protein
MTSSADRQREYRRRKGANIGAVGRPVTAPCPSVSAYKRHQRRGEKCDPCRLAWNAYQRERYAARRAVG